MAIIRSSISRAEVRRLPRKPAHDAAWIDLGDGAPLRACLIRDISDIGAKLALRGADTLPDEFTLLLSVSGPKRLCRAVWRSSLEIGVGFVLPAPSLAPEAVPQTDAPVDTAELDC